MAKQQGQRLGKGLEALLGDAGASAATRPVRTETATNDTTSFPGVSEIAIEAIEANPNQPRKHFDEVALQELEDSIKMHGVITPVTVRKTPHGKYQIIGGERRCRAARMAGLDTIPAFVRSTDDAEMLVIALVENLQREDLNALEIAVSYQRLMDECSLTQEQMSERVGKKRSTVANYLRLLQQPAEVQAAVRESAITMGHARAIAGLANDKEQIKLVRKAIDEGLSVRQVEELAKKSAQPKAAKTQPVETAALPVMYGELLDVMERYFNSTIAVKRSEKGNGSITIHFADDAEITGFLSRLKTDTN